MGQQGLRTNGKERWLGDLEDKSLHWVVLFIQDYNYNFLHIILLKQWLYTVQRVLDVLIQLWVARHLDRYIVFFPLLKDANRVNFSDVQDKVNSHL